MAATRRARGDTQQRILEFIESEVASKGYPPSVREIGDAVGLKSTSTVHGHLRRLEARGLLRRDAMKPRAMEVRTERTAPEASDAFRIVPIVGNVTAGSPILAEEYVEDQIPLPEVMLGDGENTAVNGEIIVALIDGNATVKRFYRENGRFRLQPENPAMAPIYARAIDIAGKVVSVYRLY